MKNSVLLMFCIVCQAISAQITQKGNVFRYNFEKPKTALSGVKIEVRDAGSTVSDNKGRYLLRFNTLGLGDRVSRPRITKAGFEVFNKSLVFDNWIVRDPGIDFNIVLVDSREWSVRKENLSDKAHKEREATHEREIAELTRELESARKKMNSLSNRLSSTQGSNAQLRIQLEKERLSADSLRKALQEADDRYYNEIEKIDEVVVDILSVDMEEMSDVQRQSRKLLEEGKIDEAIKVLEEQNYLEKFKQSTEEIKKAQDEQLKARKKEEKALGIRNASLGGIDQLIQDYRLQGGKDNYNKIYNCLKEMAEADTTDFARTFKLASFCHEQGMYDEAERMYIRCMNLKTDAYSHVVHLRNLSTLYADKHEFDKSEKTICWALHLCDSLYQLFPEELTFDKGQCHHNLGVLYLQTERFSDAEIQMREGARLFELDEKNNPGEHFKERVNSYIDIATLYMDSKQYNLAERYFIAADSMFNAMIFTDSTYLRQLFQLQLNMGNLYVYMGKYDKSEELLRKSLANVTKLYNINPDMYAKKLALVYVDLGSFYRDANNYPQSVECLSKALELYKVLYESNPDVYGHLLAHTENVFGSVYERMQNHEEAEKLFLSAYKLYSDLYATSPHSYLTGLTYVQNNLAILYARGNDFENAKKYYEECLKIWEENATAEQKNIYLNEIATTQHNLAVLYVRMRDFENAVKYSEMSLHTTKKLYESENDVYRLNYSTALEQMADLYLNMGELEKAEPYFLETLRQREILVTQYPDVYKPDLARAYYNVGIFYYQKTDYEKAIDCSLKSDELYGELCNGATLAYVKEKADVENNIGYLYYLTKKYDLALDVLEKGVLTLQPVIQANPNDLGSLPKIFVNIGHVRSAQKEYLKAESYYKDGISYLKDLCSQNLELFIFDLVEAQTSLGFMYEEIKQYDKAKEQFSESMEFLNILSEIDPKYKEILGRVNAFMRRFN